MSKARRWRHVTAKTAKKEQINSGQACGTRWYARADHGLSRIGPSTTRRKHSAVLRVLDSRNWWATEGVEVRAFENEWAAFTGARGAVAVTNGTQALEVALTALDIGQGDEVIVPDWSFMATIGAVLAVNAIPVIVDVDPAQTWTIDVAAAAAAITARTRAFLPVHLSGNMADLDGLRELAASTRSRDPRGRCPGSRLQLAGQTCGHARRCRNFLVPGVEEHDRRGRRGGGLPETPKCLHGWTPWPIAGGDPESGSTGTSSSPAISG